MVALVNAKQAEEVGWRGVSRGAASSLPERGIQVVASADRSALARVKGLDQRFQLDEAPCKLQVEVGQGPLRVSVDD